MAGDEGGRREVRQGVASGRDSYNAARDIIITQIPSGPADSVPEEGGVPAPPLQQDSYGARELAAVLGRLFPGREIPGRWTDGGLVGLRDEVDAAPGSEHKVRAGRVLDSLVTARKTTAFQT